MTIWADCFYEIINYIQARVFISIKSLILDFNTPFLLFHFPEIDIKIR